MKELKDFDRATKSLFMVFCSFLYVNLEFPVSGAIFTQPLKYRLFKYFINIRSHLGDTK